MKLAVAIPLYNHEEYIGPALASLFAQSRPVDRVVIVDDGSTDRSREVVRQWSDPRISLLTQENAGAHVALNRAIDEAADCEFVAVLNSDDLYCPTRIEKCLGCLESHPEIQVVASALKLIDSAGVELPATAPKARWVEKVWSARRADLAEWLGIANFVKTSSNFVGRQSYFAAHPFRNYRYVHDYFFALECALHGHLAVLDDALLLYRTHPTNTIKSAGTEAVKLETLRMNGDLLRELAPHMAGSPELRKAYTGYFRNLCGNHADFRAEIFLTLIAQLLADNGSEALANLTAGMSPLAFPELTAPSSGLLKKELAREKRISRLEKSKWLRLGLKLGFIDEL
ncbi:MAG: cell wall biosynthesis glycosyltransferase [Chthoniobacteraceae bacterium]|nr:cell wall biosynthesis glycosyltransferase [Chthoniobacteraceae bacterium]